MSVNNLKILNDGKLDIINLKALFTFKMKDKKKISADELKNDLHRITKGKLNKQYLAKTKNMLLKWIIKLK